MVDAADFNWSARGENPRRRTAQIRGTLRRRAKASGPSQSRAKPGSREGVETRRGAPKAARPRRRDSPDHERPFFKRAAAKAEAARKSASRKGVRVRVPPSAPRALGHFLQRFSRSISALATSASYHRRYADPLVSDDSPRSTSIAGDLNHGCPVANVQPDRGEGRPQLALSGSDRGSSGKFNQARVAPIIRAVAGPALP